MKRVSVRGCWGQTGPFLALLCLVPRSTARRQLQWCPQWCLAQRVMLDQAMCLSLTGVHPCPPPGAGGITSPAFLFAFSFEWEKGFLSWLLQGRRRPHGSRFFLFALAWRKRGEKKIVSAHQFLFHHFPPWENLRWIPSAVLSNLALTVCLQK